MRFLVLILSFLIFVNTVLAAPFNANAKTKRIPAGTKFSLQLMNPLSTINNSAGTEFTGIVNQSGHQRFMGIQQIGN